MSRLIAGLATVLVCASVGVAAMQFTEGTVYRDRVTFSEQHREC